MAVLKAQMKGQKGKKPAKREKLIVRPMADLAHNPKLSTPGKAQPKTIKSEVDGKSIIHSILARQPKQTFTIPQDASTGYMQPLPHKTTSVCPDCKALLDALVYAENDIVWIKKECPTHGLFVEKYWEDAGMYEKQRKHGAKAIPQTNPNVESSGTNCPFDCGLCTRHKSQTALANIVVTNRCDLSCWYCFFYAKEGQPIYEPTMEQFRAMAKNLVAETPVKCNAIQLTGGEPTLREDLPEIVRTCKEAGVDHIQVNTDGINLALDPTLAKRLREAGTNSIYMSFDGVTPKTNPKNHWEVPYAMENCRKVGMGIVLVPTIIKGINDHEVAGIVNFALNNTDIIRGIIFQPVSLVGRMPQKLREQQRITIPRVIKDLEEQTGGAIRRDDFYTVPSVSPITELVEVIKGKKSYQLGSHFGCGMATYIIKGEDDKMVPIAQFVDVEGLMAYLREKAEEIRSGKSKYWVGLKVWRKLGSFINTKKQPKGFNLSKLLFAAITKHNYRALGDIQHRSLLVGMMHFMDSYNYDVERVERCCIHYTMPDGRIVPFCAFNVMPEVYRDKVQAQYAIPQKEWEKKSGETLMGCKYKRDIKKLESGAIYKKAYSNLKNYFE